MPSRSLQTWYADGRRALDEIEAAHRAVGRVGPGSRFAAQQINQAYVVLLSAQFQRFCRDLHSQCVEHLVHGFVHPTAWVMVRRRFEEGRKLDTGNPTPANIGSDFDRLGIKFWPALHALGAGAEARHRSLSELIQWRNAIAHQDFTHSALAGRERLQLAEVRRWRPTCEQLAVDFERVMHHYLSSVTGSAPW